MSNQYDETTVHYGPKVPYSDELHAMKYRLPGEPFREAMNRIAGPLSDNPAHFHAFRDCTLDMRYLPAGRIQAAVGTSKHVTAFNCYVSGTIGDSFVEGDDSIMRRATEAAATMRMGGGIGYDFSTLRPRGALITKLMSQSSGPVSFMEIFDAVCRCTSSSGHRRGAQMGVLRVDHPDIEEFVHAKQNETRLRGFNISVAATDEFMQAVALDRPFDLRFGGKVYRTIEARALWDSIMRSTWDWAEPGVLFIDTMNRMNNLWYCETIAATNPCGEQNLPPHGACLLGSFNLTRYLRRDSSGALYFDWTRFEADIPHVVRAMDNVIDVSLYPLPQQEVEAKAKRRMGLGITGLANAAECLGKPYGSLSFLAFEREVLHRLARNAYLASVELAIEKGPFPLFDADRYCESAFIKTLDKDVQDRIRRYGIRNSHLTSIAPTGTISLCADNVSSSIEPPFAYEFDRTVIEFSGPRVETVKDWAYREHGVKGKRTADVTVQEHVDVLCMAARHVDSAVSKTCNVDGSVPWDDFKQVYMRAWEGGAKGCTTFRKDGKRGGILVEKDEKTTQVDIDGDTAVAVNTENPVLDGGSCTIDPVTGRRSCE